MTSCTRIMSSGSWITGRPSQAEAVDVLLVPAQAQPRLRHQPERLGRVERIRTSPASPATTTVAVSGSIRRIRRQLGHLGTTRRATTLRATATAAFTPIAR